VQSLRPLRLAVPSLLVAAALAATALSCGDEGDASRGGSEEIRIAATTGIAADIVEHVAGDGVEVTQIVPDGAGPHSYAPSAREQQEIAEADLLVLFHPAFEESLPIDSAPSRFAIADHVGRPAADPHVWLDPTAVAAALPALAEAIAGVDPSRAGEYRERARRYGKELRALDSELAEIVAAVPRADRKLVTSHDSMGYFADRYGFRFIGAPFGLSPEAEAGAGDVAELIDLVEDAGVPAVFAEQGDDPEVLRLIADEAGVEVVDDLLVENLGERAGTYAEMMRETTGRITTALGG
jgi:ABC-type Zn uptake system ZnuABC Zn-binding protein ZnuA